MKIVRLDLQNSLHVQALRGLLMEYALTPEGGGEPLSTEALERLPGQLASRPHYAGWLACAPGEAGFIGLLNAFEGLSTFRARPLLNLHDIVVTAAWRGRGAGRALIGAAQAYAKSRDCCKLTLEVLEGNTRAIGLYRSAGFDPYELDPAMGRAMFFEKWLD
ncbi:MAG: GNAT family N-acetyltransferase [Burkholderiaceae bacterium]